MTGHEKQAQGQLEEARVMITALSGESNHEQRRYYINQARSAVLRASATIALISMDIDKERS